MKQSPSLVRDHLQVEKPTPHRNLDRQEETDLDREDSETNIWGKIIILVKFYLLVDLADSS